jgi:peptidyl-prolyl cis-trans isomerase A (cyclophilin A)
MTISEYSFPASYRQVLTTLILSLSFSSLLGFSQVANARTLVKVTTTLGDFTVELFDEETPQTVANFLNYVTSGRYDGTVIHRLVPNFVFQGGWLTFDESAALFSPITTDPTVQNEPGISNTRGTIAMAKLGGDPNSATSQWFVNLVDNTDLDDNNGGYTAFGRVLEEDMDVVDAIGALDAVTLVSTLDTFPVINYSGGSVLNSNLVNIAMSVIDPVLDPPNYFDEGTGLLHVTVDAGASGIGSIVFNLTSTDPEVIIQLDLASVQMLSDSVENIATFDGNTGELVIPELVVGEAVAYRNLRFLLSDAEQFIFTLNSFEPI